MSTSSYLDDILDIPDDDQEAWSHLIIALKAKYIYRFRSLLSNLDDIIELPYDDQEV